MMMRIPKVKIKPLHGDLDFTAPRYMSAGASGMDVAAANPEPILLEPMERRLIPCGFSMELPEGYEAQIRPRSGLAIRKGVTCLNTPGTIDQDYRGEIQVILINLGKEPFEIKAGDRIAQMVIQPVVQVQAQVVDEINDTGRGEGGFGSTGHA